MKNELCNNIDAEISYRIKYDFFKCDSVEKIKKTKEKYIAFIEEIYEKNLAVVKK